MENNNPNFGNMYSKIASTDILNEANNLIKQSKHVVISENLKKVLASQEMLKELKGKTVVFSEPILKQGENPVIFPHTINVIQGQTGVHKSRLAETICSAFLKRHDCTSELMGFQRSNFDANFTVVYVDTERNLKEQLPFALQSIQKNAGFAISDHPINFKYISLLQINRKERFETITEYLNYIKAKVDTPLFIVLDVSTDCIEDFNKVEKTMELIDLMNMTVNEHNVTFLCVIHENPKSDKARGHFGTELMNKASTHLQLSFEKDAKLNDTDLIRVKYMKCRSTAKHSSFHIKYDSEKKGLVLATESDIVTVVNSKKQKAHNEDIIEFITMYLADGSTITRVDLLDKLKLELKASIRTIEERIAEIIKAETVFLNENGEICKLTTETLNKNKHFKLTNANSL